MGNENGNHYRNHYISVRDLGALGIYLNGNSVELVQRSGQHSWYCLRTNGRTVNVSSQDIGILMFSTNPEDIRHCFYSHYLEKLMKK